MKPHQSLIGGALLVTYVAGLAQHAKADLSHTLANTFGTAYVVSSTSEAVVLSTRLVYAQAVEFFEDGVSKYARPKLMLRLV